MQPSRAASTTETSPDGNDGVFAFATPYWPGEGDALASASFYQGSVAPANLLESITASNTLTLNYLTGQGLTYELFQGGTGVLWRQQMFSYNDFGNPLYVYDYDWGTCFSCGSILRNVTVSYAYSLPPGMNLPGTTTMSPYTGAGGQISQTVNSYDSATGNLLGTNEYTSSSTYITKSYTYNANGTVAKFTDTKGAQTIFTYTGAGQCLDTGGHGVFPTLVQSPVAAVATTETWNCTGGVLLTLTDGNGAKTTYTYSDPANTWRPSAVTDALNNTAALTYPTAAAPTTGERSMLFNANNSISDVVTIVDGLGRPMLSQTAEDPTRANWDSAQTGYDAMDRVNSITVPYVKGEGQPAPGGTAATTTTYDALSRPYLITDSGGATTQFTYTDNDVLETLGPAPGNENAKRRQEEFDGLDRLKSVCELTGAPGSGACGQNAGQTGYWTEYTRDALGDLTGVTQNAQGSPTQNRSFAFDWLGRMTSETNPESGTATYTYDSGACGIASHGDLIARQDAAGNVACYTHDALRRVTNVHYPSGPNAAATPDKNFVYDSSSGLEVASVPGYASTGSVGRLVEAYTGAAEDAAATVVGWGYDALGRATFTAEGAPNSWSWITSSEAYFPNGARASLSVPNGSTPFQFTYGLDGEGRPTTVSANSGQNPVQSATYLPFGLTALTYGSHDMDVFKFDAAIGRMSEYDLSVGTGTNTGTPTWNANGTLKSFTISDTIAGNDDNGVNCTYTHDDLGRLLEANCGSADDEQFAWDQFGNRNTTNTPANLVTNFTWSNNRIGGGSYDPDGNLLQDPLLPGTSNQFDSEGHAVSFWGNTVVFDALGRALATASKPVLYAPDGSKLGTMASGVPVAIDVPLPGGASAVYGPSGLSYYRHPNWLGSAAVASSTTQTLKSSDYYTPFGLDETGSGAGYHSFTGIRQDTDSIHTGGQYDFLMREYNPIQGRWWTPDPAGLSAVDPENPQTFNRYAYVNGKPTEVADDKGQWPTPVHNEILERAFPGLSQFQLGILEGASRDVDAQQSPEESNKHSMCVPGQSMAACDTAISGYVWADISAASGEGPDTQGLYDAGLAMHTMADMGSPYHTDGNGSPITWSGTLSASGLGHIAGEDANYWVMGAQMYDHTYMAAIAQSVLNVQAVYLIAFGQAAYSSATSGLLNSNSQRAWANAFLGGGGFPSALTVNELYGCFMGNPAACPDASDLAFAGAMAGGSQYLGFVILGGRIFPVK